MFGKDYQVLYIDYAVSPGHRAYVTKIKGLTNSYSASPLTILGALFF